jgi:hypothetical protein
MTPILTRQSDSRRKRTKKSEELFELLYQLPRELRNRVYTFCVQGLYDDEVIVRRSATVHGATALLVRECTGRHSYRWIEDPIDSIINALDVEHDYIAREMIEAYYWTRIFKVSSRELSLIGPFLETDKFGLGMTPACYARRLQIQIHADDCAQARRSKAGRAEYETNLQIIGALGAVLSTRTEVIIDVGLLGDERNDGDNLQNLVEAGKILDQFMQAVELLRDSGVRIAISYTPS